ncbi:hypothetical protein K2173_017225 [Erythroxylum novogranatense]|uniref:Protein tweety homolog n=1 Tax=Erythroxylum novogranatense TaxID=1862640 RepID=A0AAV8U9L7_9ROSI|nr:hypothetical protein K2173_017225 [Erythroxylum novogranatense]
MGATQLVVAVPIVFLELILRSTLVPGQPISSASIPGTNLLQLDNASQGSRQSDDTVRVDPLDNFDKYRGGYDITNKHYWSSTAFTGISGYSIGILWLLVGLLCGSFLLATLCCCRNRRNGKLKNKYPCLKQCYLWPIILSISLTILAVTASGLVLGGNERFHSRAKTVLDIIIDTANGASDTIYNTTGAMKGIRDNLGSTNESIIENFGASGKSISDASFFLMSTSEKLDAEAANIRRQARKNSRLIDKGLKIVYIVITLTISLNLTAVVAVSIIQFLKSRSRALHLLITFCWFLTALCWLFFGIYFFLHNFSRDTCTALENFQENPNNSSLSSILPCDELISAKPVLSDVGSGVYNLVNQINANLSALQRSSSAFFAICNPFTAPPTNEYRPDDCPENTIRVRDIPEVLKVLTCSDSNNGTCEDGQFIPASTSKTLTAYAVSLQDLLDAFPGMQNLLECKSVKDAFSEILLKHCKPLKRKVHMVWASLVCLAMIMVLLVLVWIVEAQHEQEHHSKDGSVKPHSTKVDGLEHGAA